MPTTCDRVHYGRDRMRPCIYGLAAGDAPGVQYEFSGRGTLKCTGMVGNGTQAVCRHVAGRSCAALCDTLRTIRNSGTPPKRVGRLRGKAVIEQCI